MTLIRIHYANVSCWALGSTPRAKKTVKYFGHLLMTIFLPYNSGGKWNRGGDAGKGCEEKREWYRRNGEGEQIRKRARRQGERMWPRTALLLGPAGQLSCFRTVCCDSGTSHDRPSHLSLGWRVTAAAAAADSEQRCESATTSTCNSLL